MGDWGAERDVRDSRVYNEPDTVVPDLVKQFVAYFYRHIREKNVYEILGMYETSFFKLTERFFKASPWPTVAAIAPIVDNDHVFCLLYKELYYRHLYARLSPTLEQRCESWDNYCALFGIVLQGNVNMQLPNQWLWDMVDEFIYQFQSFCQYRGKLSTKTPEELALLRSCDQVWNVLGVLNILQALIDKSGIENTLANERSGQEQFAANEGYDYSQSNVLRLLGYFSMVGLLRVHCLIGDYHGGLKASSPIDLDKSGMFTKVPGCYISLLYYTGFALMTMKRHVDAVKTFNTILGYIMRSSVFLSVHPQYNQMVKKNEQMYALMAMSLSLCPAAAKYLDEGVSQTLREKYNDKMIKMAAGEITLFDELYTYACPKFITPCPPNFDDPSTNYNQDAYRLQLNLFLEEVRPQTLLPTVRSFLKLYTTISIRKLSSFLELDQQTVRATLLMLKMRSRQPTIKPSRGVLDADWESATDTDFYIDGDMVHVVDNKVQRQFSDFFATHILKLDRISLDIGQVHEVVAMDSA